MNNMINGLLPESRKQYNSPKEIGNISEIFAQNKFHSIKEYEDFYFSKIMNRIELRRYSELIHFEIGNTYGVSTNEIFKYLYDLIIVKSWDGFINRENKAISYLKEKGFYSIKKASLVKSWKNKDSEYAIDIICKKEGFHKFFGVQVKPKSFLSSKYRYHQVQNFKKNIYFLQEQKSFGLVVYLYIKNNEIEEKIYNMSELMEMIN